MLTKDHNFCLHKLDMSKEDLSFYRSNDVTHKMIDFSKDNGITRRNKCTMVEQENQIKSPIIPT